MNLKKRPKPQRGIDTRYMKKRSDSTMMVLADPIFLGHAPSISMKVKDLIILADEDEQAAEEYASTLIAKHMKDLCKHWEIVVTDEPFANKDAEIESIAVKLGKEPTQVSLREKNAHEKASALTVFINTLAKVPGPIMRRIEAVLDGCIAAGKPVCVIDSFGVKRYPRR
jgi:hypothetical protein